MEALLEAVQPRVTRSVPGPRVRLWPASETELTSGAPTSTQRSWRANHDDKKEWIEKVSQSIIIIIIILIIIDHHHYHHYHHHYNHHYHHHHHHHHHLVEVVDHSGLYDGEAELVEGGAGSESHGEAEALIIIIIFIIIIT